MAWLFFFGEPPVRTFRAARHSAQQEIDQAQSELNMNPVDVQAISRNTLSEIGMSRVDRPSASLGGVRHTR
jgi:hypothetical protein